MLPNQFKASFVAGSTNVKYAAFQLSCFEAGAVASGMRVGGINECAQAGVSPDLIACVSGHKLRNLGTLWHYLNVVRPMTIPAGTVQAGWGAGCHEYGRIDGPCPKPAAFMPALKGLVDPSQLEEYIDLCLWLRPTRSPPRALRDGNLRPWYSAIAATLTMNYSHFCKANEVEIVRVRMRNALADAKMVKHESFADETLKRWGELTVGCCSLLLTLDYCCCSVLLIAAHCCCSLLLLTAAAHCCCSLLLLTLLTAAAHCCCSLLLLLSAAHCWLLLLSATHY
jgi:hypothetical protein